MALWRLYYHLVWSTKGRLPLIEQEIESELYGYMIGKTDALDCIVHAIGGIENHVHLIVSIPPKMAISKFVNIVKGSTSHHVTKVMKREFAWQEGYGVFSLGSKQLEKAVNYVIHQKQHHRDGSVISSLETCTQEDNGPWKYDMPEPMRVLEDESSDPSPGDQSPA